MIGIGSFGVVKRAKYKGNDVAVKIFNIGVQNDFAKEANNLKRISHENIIKIIDYGDRSFNKANFDFIVMEYAEMGSLHKCNA